MNLLALIKTQKYLSVMELACVAPGEECQSYLLNLFAAHSRTRFGPSSTAWCDHMSEHGQNQGFSCRIEGVSCHKIQTWYPRVQGQAEQGPEEPELVGAKVEGL